MDIFIMYIIITHIIVLLHIGLLVHNNNGNSENVLNCYGSRICSLYIYCVYGISHYVNIQAYRQQKGKGILWLITVRFGKRWKRREYLNII